MQEIIMFDSGFRQPIDKKIYLEDIIENGLVDRDKSYCIDANYFKGTNLEQYLSKARRQVVFNYSSSGRGNGKVEARFIEADKAQTLCASGYSNRSITAIYEKQHGFNKGGFREVEKFPTLRQATSFNYAIDDSYGIRKLTPIECERLQTMPEGYTNHVSSAQRYKALGNGWTIDVIVKFFENIKP